MICPNCGQVQNNKLGNECLYCKDEKIELRLKGFVHSNEVIDDLDELQGKLIADNKCSVEINVLIQKYRKLNV